MPRAFHGVELVCPHEGDPLSAQGSSLRCSSGHVFDISRHGYLHLMPVAHKASRSPGDSAAMVAARRRVLDAGLFAPLLQRLLSHPAIAEATEAADRGGGAGDAGARHAALLDAGCGEGHYLAAFAERWPTAALLGIDVSKPAVLAAARRHPGIAFVVASNRRLPVAPGRARLILCLFGFACWDAWAAHQRADQCVIGVDPGPDHLLELRQRIYPSVRRRPGVPSEAAVRAGYALVSDDRLRVQLDAPPVDALLEMTPHARRIATSARDRLLQEPPESMTIDVNVREWRRRA